MKPGWLLRMPPAPASCEHGFTLVELLVSVVILGVAAGAVVQGANIAINSSRTTRNLTEINTLINRDLKWLGWYAQAWKCQAGACKDIPEPGVALRYESVPCDQVIDRFLADAASPSAENNLSPSRPFPVPAQPGTPIELNPNSAVTRTINRPQTASISLEVTHTHADPPVNRFASVLIKAGSWCTP